MSLARKPVPPSLALRRQLSRLWLQEIQQLYKTGTICSPTHFQCEMYYWLRKKTNAKKQIGIWADVVIPELDNLKTDLLVTFEEKVIGMIELKYVPHGFPRYENNFQKFEKIRRSSSIRVRLITNPQTGTYDKSRTFSFAEDCLFVFAAIARYNSDAFSDLAWEELTGSKLMLTGKIDSPDAKLFEVNPEFGRR